MKAIDFYLQQLNDSPSLTLDSSWGQGRTTFGGMSAALALAQLDSLHQQQCQQKNIPAATLRSLNVAFCGPLFTEHAFELNARTVRSGKSIHHLQAEVIQDEQVATLVNACYGQSRNSDIQVDYPQLALPPVRHGDKLSYIEGLTPEFVRHIDFIYHSGQFPFTASEHNHIEGFMRFSDHPERITNAHLVALIDAWPPTVLQKLKQPAPCASVSWSLELITPLEQLATPLAVDDYLYYRADIRQAHDGYAHTEAKIAAPDGTLLALSRQLVVAYDKR